jgi:hypothetical protein
MLKMRKKNVLPFIVLFACFMTIACGYLAAGASTTHRGSNRQFKSVKQLIHNIPLAFEQNIGQAASEAKYISRGPGYELFLTTDQAVFTFSSIGGAGGNSCKVPPATPESMAIVPPHSRTQLNCEGPKSIVRLRLLGANPDVRPKGTRPLSSYSNYFIGSDAHKWRTHVPQFAEVWYRNIYPGIDLDYRTNNRVLEYDLTVAPHANAAAIAFSIDDTENRVRMNVNGDLLIGASEGDLLLQQPRVYVGNGCAKSHWSTYNCRLVNGGRFTFRRSAANSIQINFELPTYDHSQTLVIDPVVSFSTFLGGSLEDSANGMALDSSGNIYLIGQTTSTDFPTTTGGYQKMLAGNSDIFMTELSADGSRLIYSTYLGGTNSEYANGIALDSANNAYVTGETYSTDFPVVNAYQSQSAGGTGFVSKLSADGTTLVFSTYLGGSLEGACLAIAVDGSGEAVVAGRTYSTDFPIVNAFQPVHAPDNGDSDGFITKLSASGNSLIFSTYFGGNSNDFIQGLTLDPSANVYVTGLTFSSNFPTTAGSFQPQYVSDPGGASFVSKFDTSGQNLLYSTYLIGGQAFAIAVNSSGNAYVTGSAGGGFPITPGAFQTTQGGGSSTDAFITEFDATGSSLVYSTFLGGNNIDGGYAIALDSSGNAYVTGQTASQNFPLQAPVQPYYGGVPNVFVSEVNNTGSQLIFSTYLGGGAQGYGDQQGNAIAIDASGNMYVAGYTATPDFPVVNPLQSQLLGFQNAFIAKLLNTAAPEVVVSPGTLSFPSEVVNVASPAETITVTNSGTVPLSISSVTTNGDFSETNGCNSAIAPKSSCAIQASFTPSQFGTRTGQVNIFNNATLQAEVVQLSGTGEDFELAGSPASQSVSPGQTATYSLTLTPEGGFNKTISFSCTGSPSDSDCSVNPSSVTLDGTTTSSATVTIVTTAQSTSALKPLGRAAEQVSGKRVLAEPSFRVTVVMLILCCIGLLIPRQQGKEVLLTLILIVLTLSLVQCGGGSSSGGGGGGGGGTPAGSYLITVTGTTSGNLNHAIQPTLTVN